MCSAEAQKVVRGKKELGSKFNPRRRSEGEGMNFVFIFFCANGTKYPRKKSA
jgi:hypothetical protein